MEAFMNLSVKTDGKNLKFNFGVIALALAVVCAFSSVFISELYTMIEYGFNDIAHYFSVFFGLILGNALIVAVNDAHPVASFSALKKMAMPPATLAIISSELTMPPRSSIRPTVAMPISTMFFLN